MPLRARLLSCSVLFGAVVVLGGCTAWFDAFTPAVTRTGVSSSLVDYLYPDGQIPPDFDEQVPRLKLPLRVGIAFVPQPSQAGSEGPAEALKNEVLQKVREQFKARKYIASIEVIPDTYLRSTRGFEGMQQVARLYAVDVMALVSYDQLAATGDNKLALTYWTIVGAYVIKGTENQTQTFVDTAVFDVASRKLLFRAPGVDNRERTSTAIEAAEVSRAVRAESFAAAMASMGTNLAAELDRFEQRLKDEPEIASVEWKAGSGGGGGSPDPALLVLLAICAWWRRPRA
ncbi:MAG: rhombotarget lipoprotein [Gammaproteobacteria bacterium]|jgi:rhombotail lipoprotein|nr:rhombotarget lipoprotein [Gammaproteobacteria bacterium]